MRHKFKSSALRQHVPDNGATVSEILVCSDDQVGSNI